MIERKQCPVFVMAAHGRNESSVRYPAVIRRIRRIPRASAIYQVLIPRFGRVDRLENRKKMMAAWLRSKGFRRSGLDSADLSAKVLENCRSGGDFLSIVMGEIARKQQATRWALYSPDTVLRVATTKQEIPEALFVHIIRDGRDIALSLRKLGDFHPFPWSRRPRSLEETALYWEWMVQKGVALGARSQMTT